MTQPMGDSHRRFLQTMMAHGIIDKMMARSLHKHCCEIHKAQYAHDRLDEFIGVINSRLQPMFMQIRKGISEDNGFEYYALVNLANTDVTKMSSDYADNELELFQKIIDLIVDSDEGIACSTEILNHADSLQSKKLKKSDAEHLLRRLVLDNWLNEKQGNYTLTTRCIIDMDHFIRTVYADRVKMCSICRSIALQKSDSPSHSPDEACSPLLMAVNFC
ncbi:non-structural maintenance of chromosomes element 1 homolog isoform X2 [Lampris incognitus]|uniref:non-structural maintenance of chromosomes element 1 homolog isoform X2 n=1 Tax=Lampris incognitus TaxID=2546036 RepID=UPI0024B50AE7|nr:non-structural maintenance of chromosomes element 1 homolog isoform X2 [Lampris incognitus]